MMINIFIFRYADPEAKDYYFYFADQMTQNNSPDYPYNKKLGCPCLIQFGKQVKW